MLYYYIFDGSFEGFLTAIYESYYNSKKPELILTEENYVADLFSEPVYIITDENKSVKVYNSLREKLTSQFIRNVFYVFLSEEEEAPTLLYHYIRKGFIMGPKIDLCLKDPEVLKVQKLQKKVTYECHRMLGFIRFSSLKPNLLYSAMEPDYNILSIIVPHFTKRLSSENFIIHDVKREIAAMYNKDQYVITPFQYSSYLALKTYSAQDEYELLWQEYFKNIAIAKRANPRLQKRCMPLRYWKHMLETKWQPYEL